MEFKEVMKQHRRMCAEIQQANRQTGFSSCNNCPMDGLRLCYMGSELRDATDAEIEQAEKVIMKWAKENPEPVYPTWLDWLHEQGVLKYDEINPNMRYWYTIDRAIIERPIPTDIAEKLGLEPKKDGV